MAGEGGGGLFDGLFGGLLGGLGSVFSGIFGANSQESANRANIEMAREQMRFQERMSSTAYQRAMRDADKAGLNPAIIYGQGGASQPQGAFGESRASSMPNVGEAFGNGAVTATEAKRNTEMLKNMESDRALTDQQNKNEFLREDQINASTNLTKAQAVTQLITAKQAKVELDAALAELGVRKDTASFEREKLKSRSARFEAIMDNIGRALEPAHSGMNLYLKGKGMGAAKDAIENERQRQERDYGLRKQDSSSRERDARSREREQDRRDLRMLYESEKRKGRKR